MGWLLHGGSQHIGHCSFTDLSCIHLRMITYEHVNIPYEPVVYLMSYKNDNSHFSGISDTQFWSHTTHKQLWHVIWNRLLMTCNLTQIDWSWHATWPCWHQSVRRTCRPRCWRPLHGSHRTHRQCRCWTAYPRHASCSTCGCWTSALPDLVWSTFTHQQCQHFSLPSQLISFTMPSCHTSSCNVPLSVISDKMQSDLSQSTGSRSSFLCQIVFQSSTKPVKWPSVWDYLGEPVPER